MLSVINATNMTSAREHSEFPGPRYSYYSQFRGLVHHTPSQDPPPQWLNPNNLGPQSPAGIGTSETAKGFADGVGCRGF